MQFRNALELAFLAGQELSCRRCMANTGRLAGAEGPDRPTPRFGSCIELVHILSILVILSFAIFYDIGAGHAFKRLEEGMRPTEVAGIPGEPRSESRSKGRVVQTWNDHEGRILELEFEAGRLVAKTRTSNAHRHRACLARLMFPLRN